jgi:hypothetical protein
MLSAIGFGCSWFGGTVHHALSSTAVFWLECPDADGMPSLLHGVAAWDGLGAAVLLCLLTVVIRGPLEGGAS